jgi:hypothetical protein
VIRDRVPDGRFFVKLGSRTTLSYPWSPWLSFLTHEAQVLLVELSVAFLALRIYRDTVHRTDLNALRGVEMTDAFGAKLGIDLIDFFALINCLVGTFGLTDVAIDAFVSDH